MPFVLNPLPYAFDALLPYIDARTMEIHYTKHHQGYVDNLNKIVEPYPYLQSMRLEQLLVTTELPSQDVVDGIRNFGGGHSNHTFFWSIMQKNGGGEPCGHLKGALEKEFGSIELFKNTFNVCAKKVFGSGWAWLVLDPATGRLSCVSTANQDSPLRLHLVPLIGLDVWEHAYYLHYQNRRADYIDAWWHVLNWDHIESLYEQAVRTL